MVRFILNRDQCDINANLPAFEMIYLLTAIRLTVHIYAQTTHRTTQLTTRTQQTTRTTQLTTELHN